jgi:hypothetical protein
MPNINLVFVWSLGGGVGQVVKVKVDNPWPQADSTHKEVQQQYLQKILKNPVFKSTFFF